MKAFYFLLIFLSSSILLNAQEFSTQFYFTDTLGNQDSVIVGFDPTATLEVDGIFGEVDLKEVPFENDFEVRVGQIDHENLGCFPNDGPLNGANIDSDQSGLVIRIGKKDYNGISCENGMLNYQFFGKTTFFIKNNNLPVKINWDIEVFSKVCLSKSFFTDWHPGLWFDATCGGGNSFIEEISEIAEYWVNEPTNLQIVDRSGDTLSMVHLALLDGLTSSTKSQALPTFQTFPNPAQDQLTIQLPDPKSRPWKLLNINGAIVKTGTINSATEQINLEDLTDGIYFLQVASFKAKRILVGLR